MIFRAKPCYPVRSLHSCLMKLFPSLLAIVLGTAPLRAGDGYQYEASAAKEVVALVKTIKVGEVVKVRRVNMDFDRLEENSYTAVFFSHKRDFAPENQFTVNVTEQQKTFLETCAMVYLRRTANGWQYLGTKVSRDAKGVLIYQY